MSDSSARSLISTLVERYRQWSSPIRGAFWVAIVLVAYFGLIEPAWTSTRSLSASSDALQQDIENLKSGSARDRETIRVGRERWGIRTIEPRGASELATLQKVLTSVLETHGVRSGVTIKDIGFDDAILTSRSEGVGGNALTIRKLKTQVQFSASPDVLNAVLADLELHPNVACIQRLTIRRNPPRPVLEVTLVAQSWQKK